MDFDLAVWQQTMSELLTVIHLDPMKGNFQRQDKKLVQVQKSCTDVFPKG